MEKVGLRPWCDQPSDRGRLRNRTEHVSDPNSIWLENEATLVDGSPSLPAAPCGPGA